LIIHVIYDIYLSVQKFKEGHKQKRCPYPKEIEKLDFTLLNFPWPRPDFKGIWQLKPVSGA